MEKLDAGFAPAAVKTTFPSCVSRYVHRLLARSLVASPTCAGTSWMSLSTVLAVMLGTVTVFVYGAAEPTQLDKGTAIVYATLFAAVTPISACVHVMLAVPLKLFDVPPMEMLRAVVSFAALATLPAVIFASVWAFV